MDWMLLSLLLLLLALFITCFMLVVYSGLFHQVIISTGANVISDMTIAYKFYTGPYKDCGAAFTAAVSLVPGKTAVGIYYDDPKVVPSEQQRYAVGCIVSGSDGCIDEKAWAAFKEHGYCLKKLPVPAACVYTSFPYTTDLSVIFAVWRVYPILNAYIMESSLSWGPSLEIYEGNTIKFIVPQDKQDGFYVPEASGDHKPCST